jgi:redox-sensitive bicupin YhaK (pirin superfamily)
MHPAILNVSPLGFPWVTPDPFLFCVYHDDKYPAGNAKMGPDAPLTGRNIGQDFEGKDGWRMYHGEEIPGFPQHPHRGFETVTLVRKGLIDHSDSLGATARFGQGDVQWLTAGKGILHCEMFPLLDSKNPNPLELFQIWLNLPPEDKLVAPHFGMFWDQNIPRVVAKDPNGKVTQVVVVAGKLGDTKGSPPPPKSWAARPDTDVTILTIKMEPGALWTLPPGQAGSNRMLYFFKGSSIQAEGKTIPAGKAIQLRADAELAITNGTEESEFLLLGGRPIGKPVAQYGPFVMNTQQEIKQAFLDYQTTQFGGWPWPVNDPIHPRSEGRFAKHADGKVERAPG